jgi:DNA polymerase III sliding clamp (beta) subunit (PCNA family)
MNKYKNEIKEGYFVPNDRFTIILNDDTNITTGLLIGDYPDLDKHFPNIEDEFIKLSFTKPINIKRHIDFLSNMLSDDKVTTFKINGNICGITSIDSNLGILEEEIEMDQLGLGNMSDEILIHINPVLLQGYLNDSSIKFYPKNCVVLIGDKNKMYLINTIK